jgi:hypothetical protein
MEWHNTAILDALDLDLPTTMGGTDPVAGQTDPGLFSDALIGALGSLRERWMPST